MTTITITYSCSENIKGQIEWEVYNYKTSVEDDFKFTTANVKKLIHEKLHILPDAIIQVSQIIELDKPTAPPPVQLVANPSPKDTESSKFVIVTMIVIFGILCAITLFFQ